MRTGILLVVTLQGCAAPIAELWPPRPGTPTHRITVALDPWHSVIGVIPPDAPSQADGARMDWGYADYSYYLTRAMGFSGCCGALFWPTQGVLRVARSGLSVFDTAEEPAQRWTFELSEAGYESLIAFLEHERASDVPVSRVAQSDWFSARYSYHMFHHCNQWTTRALRSAGLPVWSFYSLFRWSFVMQLDRAASFAPRE